MIAFGPAGVAEKCVRDGSSRFQEGIAPLLQRGGDALARRTAEPALHLIQGLECKIQGGRFG